MSIRRACGLIRFDPRTYRYQFRRPDQAAIEQRIKEICQTRVRFGYRRVHVLLRREGWGLNAKKTYRIYKELGMQLRNKTPKRRVKAKLREDRKAAVSPNDVWAMDFVHDQLATGRKIRILTVVDTFSRLTSRYWTPGSATRVRTSLQRWITCAAGLATLKQSGSTMGVNLSRATWTSGRTNATLLSTSHVQENPRITPTSRPSTAGSALSA